MITHIVIFRAKRDEHKAIILEEVKKLGTIEVVESFACGVPNPSERGVVDDTFAVATVTTFKDQAAMEIYDKHPVHMKFYENCLNKYKVKVQVFDIAD